MKKVYLLLTAICLTALTGCIKEEPYTLETATLEVNLTRAEGDTTESEGSQEQGDGIKDVMVWAFQCNADGVVEDEQQTAVGWRTEYNVDTYQSVSVHVPLPVCNDQQWYMLVAVLNTSEFGTAEFSSRTTYNQLKAMTFDASSRTFWKSYPNDTALAPEDMPVSNWAKFLLKNTNKHANNQCYTLNMPVYRAVAKTQLFVSKESNDYALEITEAWVHAGSAPTKGFVLSATAENRTGANSEAAQIGNPTLATEGVVIPTWYSSFATADMASFSKQLRNTSAKGDETTTYSFSSVSLPKPTEADPNPVYTDVWAGSLFLYENAEDGRVTDYANYDYKTNPASVTGYNNHYYMQINYTIDGKPYTGYVPLPSVVRNHDYQVHLTVEGGGKLDLTLKVNQWQEKPETHNYLNEVSIPQGGQIQWEDGVEPDENGNITLGAAANNSVSCTFFLNTPANGTWQAELVTVEGQEGAFTFVDVEGNPIGSTTSGPIAGSATPASLTIKTTRDNSIQGGAVSENKVELRITATATVGGVQRTYKVTGLTGITGVDYYTLVQTRN